MASSSAATTTSFASAALLQAPPPLPSLHRFRARSCAPLPSRRIAAKRGRNTPAAASVSAKPPPHLPQGERDGGGAEGRKGKVCPPPMIRTLVAFLEEDLPHLFDERGITRDQYEEGVQFRDPITKYDSIDGYLFNIQMLRYVFSPKFELHSVKQSGPCEITTRWTMTMNFALLPWKPELIFTGVSIMGINPDTGKFTSHVDLWDSIKNNEYLSFEAILDLMKQLRYYKTPDLETPKYQVLKRMSTYEIRKYDPFIVVEAQGDRLTGNKGFKNVTDYIFGNNSKREKIPMTTPVITSSPSQATTDVNIQIVLPLKSNLSSLPDPLTDAVKVREVPAGLMAALKFSGDTTEEIATNKEQELRSCLIADGLDPKPGFMLARYNDPGRTRSFIRRNEVLIGIGSFTME